MTLEPVGSTRASGREARSEGPTPGGGRVKRVRFEEGTVYRDDLLRRGPTLPDPWTKRVKGHQTAQKGAGTAKVSLGAGTDV